MKFQEIKHIMVLTGAGISAESGIKTFRDENGLWENHEITEVASPEGFLKNPALVQRFYNARREQLKEVHPNAAHKALAALEKEVPKLTLITQNVDDLHERAGSKNVFHMHGELNKIRNIKTGEVKYTTEAIIEKDFSHWRPDIVWFGEMIKHAEQIEKAAQNCDLFLCIGTSNNVYPAAAIVHRALDVGAICIELNLEETPLSSFYHKSIHGRAGSIVPKFTNELMTNSFQLK
ncbi:MAG: NAD-dependent protein deacylase [Halobacteriovoraceae bacterium]|nr:NAD-dependent protein deacylase [Halobacteriovoraceae bacterium]|tara:strand:+ start:18953 stop:19654 length:702 start_codon:yes stop_codon:yes gene_type:complete